MRVLSSTASSSWWKSLCTALISQSRQGLVLTWLRSGLTFCLKSFLTREIAKFQKIFQYLSCAIAMPQILRKLNLVSSHLSCSQWLPSSLNSCRVCKRHWTTSKAIPRSGPSISRQSKKRKSTTKWQLPMYRVQIPATYDIEWRAGWTHGVSNPPRQYNQR